MNKSQMKVLLPTIRKSSQIPLLFQMFSSYIVHGVIRQLSILPTLAPTCSFASGEALCTKLQQLLGILLNAQDYFCGQKLVKERKHKYEGKMKEAKTLRGQQW